MFTLIEPEESLTQKPQVNCFLEIMRKSNVLTSAFQNHSKAKYILSENTAEGFFGGAILLKQKLSHLHKDLRKSLTSLCHEDEIWTCSVALVIDQESNIEESCKLFYVELYKMLLEFGQQENINFLYMALEPGEYLSTEAIGFWPYVAEIRPVESFDGIFYGILSLTYSPNSLEVGKRNRLGSKKLAA